MRILITRPVEDAEAIAARLAELGHDTVVAPLLTIRYLDRAVPLEGVQAILATSANGVRAFSRLSARRDLPLFAVGPQTAEEARRAGFLSVRNAAGDAVALAEKARAWAAPGSGALLHVTGAERTGSLAQKLGAKGFRVETVELYEAVAAETLPPAAAEALAKDSLDAAMFFSPRSARTFVACVRNVALAERCARLMALSISEATTRALAPIPFAQIRTAGAPNQDEMLALLKP